nr:MAG TPA: hypothetical protein [Caudoviricetes sp.]
MTGLTEEQVLKNRKLYGSNKLPDPPMKKWYDFAKDALSEKITMILITIAVLQLVLGFLGVMELSEPLMILMVLAIVTGIAVKTGLGVQAAAEELRMRTSIRHCNVIRNGAVKSINTNDLVVGDVVCIQMGQEIFADGYLVEGKISVNNAAINGESKECHKTPVAGYVHKKAVSTDAYINQNCLFAGTTVVSGEGKMIVTDVGINTVNGDTLVKMQTLEAPKTALDIALDKLSGFISKWGTIAAVVTFIVLTVSGILKVGFREYFAEGILETIQKFAENLSVALTIIVAAVPEGLPLIVKLVTKQNVSTMKKSNILAKNPGKIPELAYVDLICTDKTGTLTTGTMSPEVVLNGFSEVINEDSPDILRENTIYNICLNNSATYDTRGSVIGENPTDRAILTLIDFKKYQKVLNKVEVLNKQPFNSENKYSAVTIRVEENPKLTYYKGAPEKIIDKCTGVIQKEPSEWTEAQKLILKEKIKEMNQKSMRCIALAVHDGELVENELPNDMKFLAVIGVVDPVRKEVPDAVKAAQNAGIQVIEITGDCFETAIAVAEKCGIYRHGDLALTNNQFEKMSDDEVKEIMPSLRVISRCSPNTKLRLVTLAQELGRSVAMTGDGVNDSPALKKADVGFGMQSGSDVAKEASDIVLTDDNFASVVKAVKLGRTFMHNIMMFLEFQLPINFALLILSIIYPVVSGTVLLASVQILIVNIIMDSLNSLSFGGEPPKDEYMTEKPIKKGSGLFINGAKGRIALSTGIFVALFAASAVIFPEEREGLTVRFALLCFMAVFNGFCIRTDKLNLLSGIGKNKLFAYIAAGIFAGTILLCTIAGNLIKTVPLGFSHWMTVIGLAFVVVPVDWVRKIIVKRRRK